MTFNRPTLPALLCALIILFSSFSSFARITRTDTPAKHEARAVWLTTIGGLDWPHSYSRGKASAERQKAELISILDKLQAAGINTVLFQTRIRGTVVYPSQIEPWDGCCSGIPGQSPGYDPLEFAITECHRRGMELQAWIVAIPVGKWTALGCLNLRRKYPKMIVRNGTDGFIDPSNIMAAPYIASICREITERYDIDGIHLDYIRYPETWNVTAKNRPAARKNITTIVREASKAVKSIKPWVKMSCSPIGKHADLNRYTSRGWNAHDKGCQEAQLWLREGLMDQLYPMMYFRGDQFYPFVMDWIENSAGRTVVPGLGIYFLSPGEADWPKQDVQRQINVLRSLGIGFAFFRTKFLLDNTKGIFDFTADRTNLWPALVPPVTWAGAYAPGAPINLKISRDAGITTLSWDSPEQIPAGGILYNVYASTAYPVDINDPRNLIAVRTDHKKISLNHKAGTNYAVTALNRYGIESFPVATQADKRHGSSADVIVNDGKNMFLPQKPETLDADFIIIESITGQVVATIPYRGKQADISRIKDGVYMVKSLNRNNITHNIGRLIINR